MICFQSHVVRSAVSFVASALCCASTSFAADRDVDVKVIRILPRSAQEIAEMHERARGHSCEPVPADEPLEISGFMPCLTERDRVELERGVLLVPSSRRHIFTIGLDMLSEDKARLPTLSSSQILRYLDNHYVTVQARIQKDPITSELYLHHRPLAATAVFGRGSLTQDFTDATLQAVREFHSLGNFLPSHESKKPLNLRTVVLTYRSFVLLPADQSGKARLQPNFEYVFIRARDDVGADPRQLSLFAFATSDQRSRLHFLQPWTMPHRSDQCSVHAKVMFTEFSTLGLIPTKSATRNFVYNSRRIFTWDELNRYAEENHWKGDAFDNLTRTLDLIIDGKVAPLASNP
jgi:hypothetical protein